VLLKYPHALLPCWCGSGATLIDCAGQVLHTSEHPYHMKARRVHVTARCDLRPNRFRMYAHNTLTLNINVSHRCLRNLDHALDMWAASQQGRLTPGHHARSRRAALTAQGSSSTPPASTRSKASRQRYSIHKVRSLATHAWGLQWHGAVRVVCAPPILNTCERCRVSVCCHNAPELIPDLTSRCSMFT
jgi:hypothetical protein